MFSNVCAKGHVSHNQAKAMVTDLNDAVIEIGHVVELIRDVAEQTNLLALDATTEAACEGDAGKGGVATSEVKNLARQTSASAGNLSEQAVYLSGRANEFLAKVREM